MIMRAREPMLPRLKRMWQICFEDSPRGADFVFENLLTPAQMLVQTDDNGRPIAMINWKHLRFTTPRAFLTGAYVFGVATLPEHRGKGISRSLMSELHSILVEEGASLACLVPANASLFDFYARQGFEKCFSYKKISIDGGVIPEPSADAVLTAAGLSDLAGLRNEAFADSALFGAWDGGYLGYVDRECRFYKGEVLRFSCRGKTGYAVCYPVGSGTLLVKEAVVDREDVGTLLWALHKRYGARRYELRLPEDFPGKEWSHELLPFAMVKWYDEGKRTLAGGALGGAPWFAFGLD